METESIKSKLQRQIDEMKTQLTGNLFDDMELHNQIYELKKLINPEIVNNPELDDDEGCLNCGS
jgi:hypothetical protein